ncbi:MAG: hypothetical protein GYA48_17685 [Chloroflexi bacterium]|nr:hypothetical protein [Chloroflexota bacterium]
MYLLPTKLTPPILRSGYVHRQRLIDHFHENFLPHRKLTLVSAPAGYGKTTLVIDWLHNQPRPFAWVGLDSSENDPVSFLAYFAQAFKTLAPACGSAIEGILQLPQLPPMEAVAGLLVQELSVFREPVILILDDYHVIQNPAIHQLVQLLIAHAPETVHLVITTREDPPLALPRLRVRDQLTEIRARDLRFSLEEAADFFQTSLSIPLKPEWIESLDQRTEGWAAGLQLAALSLANCPNIESFIASFSGSHRYLIDYLIDEVLLTLPAANLAFLKQTCVLKRFNASLCDFLTGQTNAVEMLHTLEQSNLFITALDEEHAWYRYHPLFADFLISETEASERQRLHARAAQWFETQADLPAAIDHSLSAADYVSTLRLLNHLTPELFRQGRIASLMHWINQIPESHIQSNTQTSIYRAWAWFLTAQPGRAQAAIQQIHQAESSLSTSEQGSLMALQALLADFSHDENTLVLARNALDHLGQEASFFRFSALFPLGHALHQIGDTDLSNQVFRETISLAEATSQPFMKLLAILNLAYNLNEQGQRPQAAALCQNWQGFFQAGANHPLLIAELLQTPLGIFQYEGGALQEAAPLLEKGIGVCEQLGLGAVLGGDGEHTLALIRFFLGDQEGALASLQDAIRLSSHLPRVHFLARNLHCFLLMKVGRLEEAALWIESPDFLKAQLPSPNGELRLLNQARYLLLTQQLEPAQALLNELQPFLESHQRRRRLISCLILQSELQAQLGNSAQADEALISAVRLAAQGGYISPFLEDFSAGLFARLQQLHPASPEWIAAILQTLLDTGLAGAPADASALEATASLTAEGEVEIFESLSEREVEILQLIARGLSNQQIADRLYISVGTVKWHANHIFNKLGVKNRIQAVAAAQELGLI